MTTLTSQISLAYERRAEKLMELTAAELQLTRSKRALVATEEAAILAGVEGKNAAERAANLNALTISERSRVAECEDLLVSAKMDFELARMETSRLRLLVQAMSVEG